MEFIGAAKRFDHVDCDLLLPLPPDIVALRARRRMKMLLGSALYLLGAFTGLPALA